MAMVDVFVGNYTLIDFDLYDLWLNGYSVHDAAVHLQRTGILQTARVTMDIVVSDVQDQYRMFNNMEKLLKEPVNLMEQQLYQIEPDVQKLAIEKYYQFDPAVVRELLGKKLSSRNRKDLEDVHEKTRIPLRSCRRQYDNMRRVFKTVEDLMGSLVDNIQSHYLISEDLAKQYAAIVFIANNRFETGKKKLSHLTFQDFAFCANLMITNWSYSAVECHAQDMDVDLDRGFLQDLRDLKLLLEKDNVDEHKSHVLHDVKAKVSKTTYKDLDEDFKNYSKAVINIAYGLNHRNEARDIFIDMVEKITDPCMEEGWTKEELRVFLQSYRDVLRHLDVFKGQPRIFVVWERYMNTLASCLAQIYHH